MENIREKIRKEIEDNKKRQVQEEKWEKIRKEIQEDKDKRREFEEDYPEISDRGFLMPRELASDYKKRTPPRYDEPPIRDKPIKQIILKKPITIKLKKQHRGKVFSSRTSENKTVTLEKKLEMDLDNQIEFICHGAWANGHCENGLFIKLYKLKGTPPNVYILNRKIGSRKVPLNTTYEIVDKKENGFIHNYYLGEGNAYIIVEFNTEKLKQLKDEVNYYKLILKEEEEKLKLEEEEKLKLEEEQKRRELVGKKKNSSRKSILGEFSNIINEFGGISPSPSKTRSKGGKKKGTRKRYAYTRKTHRR